MRRISLSPLPAFGLLLLLVGGGAFPALLETVSLDEKARLVSRLAALTGAAALLVLRPVACAANRATLVPAVASGVFGLFLAVGLGGMNAAGILPTAASLMALTVLPVAAGLVLVDKPEGRLLWGLGLLGLVAGAPWVLVEAGLEQTLDYSRWIAGLAGLVLFSLGFDLLVDGNLIHSQAGVVAVVAACSGSKLMLLITALGLAFAVVVQLSLRAAGALLAIGWLIGFAVSIVRVALMVVVLPHDALFHFLHAGAGSELVTLTALGLIAVLARRRIEGPLIVALSNQKPPVGIDGRRLVLAGLPALAGLVAGLGFLVQPVA